MFWDIQAINESWCLASEFTILRVEIQHNATLAGKDNIHISVGYSARKSAFRQFVQISTRNFPTLSTWNPVHHHCRQICKLKDPSSTKPLASEGHGDPSQMDRYGSCAAVAQARTATLSEDPAIRCNSGHRDWAMPSVRKTRIARGVQKGVSQSMNFHLTSAILPLSSLAKA